MGYPAKTGPVTCPKCGALARETQTRFGIRSSCCGLWSWERYPLVDAATHEARKKAHEAFDTLWKGPKRVMNRWKAYRLLAREMGMREADCHMKYMDRADAERVVRAVAVIKERWTVS